VSLVDQLLCTRLVNTVRLTFWGVGSTRQGEVHDDEIPQEDVGNRESERGVPSGVEEVIHQVLHVVVSSELAEG
jgi:hypothetical protein